MTWLIHLFTSFDGRISRKHWWFGFLVLWIVGIAGSLLISLPVLAPESAADLRPTIWQGVWAAALLVPTLAVTFKRLNDRDHPRVLGYVWAGVAVTALVAQQIHFPNDPMNITTLEWTLMTAGGLFGLWVLVDNGFLTGTPGPNRYGPDPLGAGDAPSGPGNLHAVTGRRPRRTIGETLRDGTVGVLGLVFALYLALPGLSIEKTAEWTAKTYISWFLSDLEDDMVKNPEGWQAFQAGRTAAKHKDHAQAVSHYTRAIDHYGSTSREAGRVLMRRGHSLYQTMKFHDALRDYSAAIAIDPDASATRYSARATVYKRLKRYRDALADYDEAVRLSPDNSRYHRERGSVLRRLGRLEQALEAHETAIAAAHKTNKEMEGHMRRLEAWKAGEGKEESAELDIAKIRALELKDYNKTLSRAHVSRGITLTELGRVDEAFAAYDEAVQQRPDNISPYKNRGLLHVQQGNLDRARADYERGLALDPDDRWLNRAIKRLDRPDASARALVDTANWLRKRGRYERALDLYDEALKQRPELVFVLIDRGWLHHERNDLDAALSDYQKAIDADPSFANAYIHRGKIHEERNAFDKSAADYERALQLEPDHWRAYLWRAWLHYRQDKLRLALSDFDRVIELNPKSDDGYFYRGNVYRDMGRFERALADYDKALELSPEYAKVYKHRGWTYAKQGDFERARDDYRRGLRLAPKDEWLRKSLAQVESMLGD